VHIAAIKELFDSGVSIVNVHSGQSDQTKVIDFYASKVLPTSARLKHQHACGGERPGDQAESRQDRHRGGLRRGIGGSIVVNPLTPLMAIVACAFVVRLVVA